MLDFFPSRPKDAQRLIVRWTTLVYRGKRRHLLARIVNYYRKLMNNTFNTLSRNISDYVTLYSEITPKHLEMV